MISLSMNDCEIDDALWAAYRRSDKRGVTAVLLCRYLMGVGSGQKAKMQFRTLSASKVSRSSKAALTN
jgi:hypothetical protein